MSLATLVFIDSSKSNIQCCARLLNLPAVNKYREIKASMRSVGPGELFQIINELDKLSAMGLPPEYQKGLEDMISGLRIAATSAVASGDNQVSLEDQEKAVEMEKSRRRVGELYEEYKSFKPQFQQDLREDQEDLDLMRRIIDRDTPATEEELRILNRTDLTQEERDRRMEDRRNRLDTTIEIYNRASELEKYHNEQADKSGNKELKEEHRKIAEEQRKLINETSPELKEKVKQFHELIDIAQDKRNADITRGSVRKGFQEWKTEILNDASLVHQGSSVVKALENSGLTNELAQIKNAREVLNPHKRSILTTLSEEATDKSHSEQKVTNHVPTPETFGKTDSSPPKVTVPPSTLPRGSGIKRKSSQTKNESGR